MIDILDEGYGAAQKAIGLDAGERLSDKDRLRAIRHQICRMDAEHLQNRPLFMDGPSINNLALGHAQHP
jgi:hypothetical protein